MNKASGMSTARMKSCRRWTLGNINNALADAIRRHMVTARDKTEKAGKLHSTADSNGDDEGFEMAAIKGEADK
jgi:hypothetical protein